MRGGSAWEREAARVTSEVARRAIRRLDVLEWVILGGAVALAVGGGALVAWVVAGSGESFRATWMVASILLFIVPGAMALMRHRRDELREAPGSGEKSDDG